MAEVIVAGSLILDLVANIEAHPQVGQTIIGKSIQSFPGGKGANQALAALKAGSKTQFIGMVGKDDRGQELRTFLAQEGLDCSHIYHTSEAATGTALILVDAHSDNTIVVVPGANMHLGSEWVSELHISEQNILVSQLEIPLATIHAFFTQGRGKGGRTILNAAPALECPPEIIALSDIFVVNETELAFFLGQAEVDIQNTEALEAACRTLQSFPEQIIIVTLGALGVFAWDGISSLYVPGHKVEARDTTGAGDCFIGNLAAQIAQGVELLEALKWANAAAALCVQIPGAGPSMPSFVQVQEMLQS